MDHIFIKGHMDRPILLLLHGTGGDEYSLLDIAKAIDSKASVLSVKGNVAENGRSRFFRRLEEGVFDQEDLIFRTRELNDFLDNMSNKYDFDRENIIGLGYSNGANMGASLLLLYPQSLRAAMLHHPMVPFRGRAAGSLKDTSIFIGAGANDPISSPEETKELANILKEQNGDLYVHWENNGHNLTNTEIQKAKAWYEENILRKRV